MYIRVLFVPPSVDGHLARFHLYLVNDAAVYTKVQGSEPLLSAHWGTYPGVAASYDTAVFNFWRNQ